MRLQCTGEIWIRLRSTGEICNRLRSGGENWDLATQRQTVFRVRLSHAGETWARLRSRGEIWVGVLYAGQFSGSVYALHVKIGISLPSGSKICGPTTLYASFGSAYALRGNFCGPCTVCRSTFRVRLRSTGEIWAHLRYAGQFLGSVYSMQVNSPGLSTLYM